jgi:UDP-N-acetylmuramyl pentapeptide phosphotransferase/UDP-N-acetylglucosamine-1-phosphate transferase
VSIESQSRVHIARLTIAGCLAVIAAVLDAAVWTWLAVTLWVIVVAYTLIVVVGIIDARRAVNAKGGPHPEG